MDEIWERAIKTALDGETDTNSVTTLTLDGAVKCSQIRFPPPSLLEKYSNLEHLSIANAGVSSLENFPNLPRLRTLVLSDNRIAGGLEHLVKAGLVLLRDLDLSNNRIQFISDLKPLAELNVVILDLYECPVTKAGNYRGEVFELVRSVKYLDKMDVNENERLESEDDEEEEVQTLSDVDEDEEVVEVHEIVDSDEEEDELEEVDDEGDAELVSAGRLTSTEGDGEEDDDGGSGEEVELSSEEDGSFGNDDIEDEDGTEFLVQPAGQHEDKDVGGSDFDAGEENDYSGEEEEVDDEGIFNVERQSQPSKASQSKRKRDEDDSTSAQLKK